MRESRALLLLYLSLKFSNGVPRLCDAAMVVRMNDMFEMNNKVIVAAGEIKGGRAVESNMVRGLEDNVGVVRQDKGTNKMTTHTV